ncbi:MULTISPECIES: pyridoxamine 5'-phosphate oxidase family protein [unclassified Tolypothrix]|uniref:pyridoxamine 5'-phosphate oxidase family protein n=1 Tax=unclassified Tolypothrix TaxID=2649714 RepID=UPI0005EABE8D|nr:MULTISPECIES: pyridoxamine 5'-phosphate oxidase family protein [unclassified Tolypothrix]BAY88470.1 pyridoxamine 5'-phosphate oxidase-related FMN-binding protein [Microchaete diplosiphon NIES-3275]EKF02144.1 pyridoxamine 5'-phosphate oxidase family protein [Tolypothrix sp. PCC 7601]MBE9084537.1 pyridoxamine 5'-phosphate oxidase family protein [Tolypothrix sp. LEGE 11397]UYD29149.1 pyridoxamine 5'-phosphate oxidase family protein [Tolypothrix sp. PCC 7712]UYD34938.1 pyridoxamine 5'-phosphate
MAKLFDCITDELQEFIATQHLFFVGSAPLSPTGHVNLSPKGLESFRILSPNRVGYLDLTGSGNETSAHLQENGRITFLFCAFQEPPKILRLYGQGYVILPGSPEWDAFAPLFPALPGVRQIIIADIERVQTSCGLGVPLYEYQDQRQSLVNWAIKKGEQGVQEYQQQKNLMSIDGLPTPLSNLP